MTSPRALALGLIPLACIVAIILSACSPYSAAWRTTSAVHSAGGLTDKALALSVDKAADKCRGDMATDVALCVRATPAWRAVQAWRSYGVPAIDSSIIATVTTLQIAERTGDKKIDWISSLRPAGCALAKIATQWGEHLGSAKTAVLAASVFIQGVSCE